MKGTCLSEPGPKALVDKEACQDDGEQRSQHHSNDQGNEAGVQDQGRSCTTPCLGPAAFCTEGQPTGHFLYALPHACRSSEVLAILLTMCSMLGHCSSFIADNNHIEQV